jgi:pyrroline-5-carboxylate reductase
MTAAVPAFDQSIALIGAGQMGRALAAGFCRDGGITAAELVVYDPIEAARSLIAESLPGIRIVTTAAEAASLARLVILAIKPQQAAAACADLQPSITDQSVVVSIVAGLPIATIAEATGTGRVIRVMPNTPCLVGQGVSAVASAEAVGRVDRDRVLALLASVGSVHEVAESLLNAVTAVSGSGPGYVALLVEALADGGVRAGLPRPLAQALAVETFGGTATLLAATGEHPAVIRDRVSSPGGTTIAGLAVLEQAGVRAAISDAVTAATARAAELARQV